jgi:NADPH:quinone reductase-like Zn-dependent oxidoreductase
MKAIVVTDRSAGPTGMKLVERPAPLPAINDVIVQVYASGFVGRSWPGHRPGRIAATMTEHRRSRDMSWPEWSLPSVTARRDFRWDSGVFGITDWYRDGTLAEYAAVEARNLAPLPGDVDFTVGASLPISGLTAWQGLFVHGRLLAGQIVLAHGAAGAVGSMVAQLAREFGAYVIGTGRAADREAALGFGANEFVDLDHDRSKTSAQSTWCSI